MTHEDERIVEVEAEVRDDDRAWAASNDCPGTCAHAQANKARALELKRVRDELRIFIGDLDAAGMKTVALGINDILEGK